MTVLEGKIYDDDDETERTRRLNNSLVGEVGEKMYDESKVTKV